MPFLQLNISAADLDPEIIEDACFAAGALSVTLSDAADQPIFEPELGTVPLWSQTRVTALFDAQTEREPLLVTLSAELALHGAALPMHEFVQVEDRDWEREWLKDFKPMRFGQRLWVCPHGQPAPDGDAIIVWLDPGLAFGTGTHPTTAMCLTWLDGAAIAGTNIIDYGCGSGILAIAALKLQAHAALAIDLDPQALIATRDNADRNGVSERITTLLPAGTPLAVLSMRADTLLAPRPRDSAVTPLLQTLQTPQPADRPTVLLANILAGPLVELAEHLKSLLQAGDRCVLSGILEEQAAAVTAAYTPWFDMQTFATRDGWVCLHGVLR